MAVSLLIAGSDAASTVRWTAKAASDALPPWSTQRLRQMQFHEACRIVLFIFWAAIGSDGRSVYDGLLAFARAGALDKRDVLSSLALPLPGCPLQSQRHRQRAVLEQRTSASSHSATGVFFRPRAVAVLARAVLSRRLL